MNCALSAKIEPTTQYVEKVKFAFGGMGPTVVVPTKTIEVEEMIKYKFYFPDQ